MTFFFGFQSNQSASRAEIANTQSVQSLSTAQIANTQSAQSLNAAESARLETEKQARLTYSNQLIAQSSAHLSNQLDLALLLAAEAYNVAEISQVDLSQARSGLLSALTYSPSLKQFIHGQFDAVNSVSVDPVGQRIASCGDNGLVYLWDAETGLPQGKPLAGHISDVNVVRFSKDGNWLASGDDYGMIILWDLRHSPPVAKHLSWANIRTGIPAWRSRVPAFRERRLDCGGFKSVYT